MAFEFHLPDIGEGVIEGEIVSWKVAEGDLVKLDQPMVEIMTDKATVEIPSPRAGRIAKINYQAGQICPVGQVLVVIDESGGSARPEVARQALGQADQGRLARAVDAEARIGNALGQVAADRDDALDLWVVGHRSDDAHREDEKLHQPKRMKKGHFQQDSSVQNRFPLKTSAPDLLCHQCGVVCRQRQ